MGWRDRFRRRKAESDRPTERGAGSPRASSTEPAPTRAKPDAGRTVLREGDTAPEPAPTRAKPSASAAAFSEGSVVSETYEIKRLLGEGGMGAVYLAHHKGWDIDLALKVPKQEVLADPEFKRRIVTEAESWTDLGMHPQIAYCYYFEPLGELPLLVVEYLEGGNLRDWIAEGKCADLRTGLDLAIQFCHALEHAHGRGLIHRDIKPENVLMTQDGTLKLTDFGIARVGLSATGRWALSGGGKTMRLWDLSAERCGGVFEGHTDTVQSVCLSAQGRWALSGSRDKTLRLWELDWELQARDSADWDEGARPYVETFLTLHTPYGSDDPTTLEGLTRRGHPSWTEEDFQGLIVDLQYAGYGWLRPEGVRREVERTAANWEGPPPLPQAHGTTTA